MRLFILLLLMSCSEYIVPKDSTTIPGSSFSVGLLFEHEGCKVYRFADGDRYKYFTNCSETISDHTENCGKNCTRTVTTNNQTSHSGK